MHLPDFPDHWLQDIFIHLDFASQCRLRRSCWRWHQLMTTKYVVRTITLNMYRQIFVNWEPRVLTSQFDINHRIGNSIRSIIGQVETVICSGRNMESCIRSFSGKRFVQNFDIVLEEMALAHQNKPDQPLCRLVAAHEVRMLHDLDYTLRWPPRASGVFPLASLELYNITFSPDDSSGGESISGLQINCLHGLKPRPHQMTWTLDHSNDLVKKIHIDHYKVNYIPGMMFPTLLYDNIPRPSLALLSVLQTRLEIHVDLVGEPVVRTALQNTLIMSRPNYPSSLAADGEDVNLRPLDTSRYQSGVLWQLLEWTEPHRDVDRERFQQLLLDRSRARAVN